MKRIGLTGGIGSGKSTVSKMFEALGVPVFYADLEARKILDSGRIRSRLAGLFGKDIIRNGKTDRKKIAAIVFSDKSKLRQLNAIIHPEVRKNFSSWMKKQKAKYIIEEAAIIFESGLYRKLDRVITVAAPEKLRIARVMKRDKMNAGNIKARMNNQWSDTQRKNKSDFIIINDEKHLLIPQVLKVHENILSS